MDSNIGKPRTRSAPLKSVRHALGSVSAEISEKIRHVSASIRMMSERCEEFYENFKRDYNDSCTVIAAIWNAGSGISVVTGRVDNSSSIVSFFGNKIIFLRKIVSYQAKKSSKICE